MTLKVVLVMLAKVRLEMVTSAAKNSKVKCSELLAKETELPFYEHIHNFIPLARSEPKHAWQLCYAYQMHCCTPRSHSVRGL